jgi:dihydrofolate reductase
MRRLVYGVATSLDGFIAGPGGEHDWIFPDSGIDFRAIYSRFDTLLMGRRTFEAASTRLDLLSNTGMRIVVASATIDPKQYSGIAVIACDVPGHVRALKAESGNDIWLMGGGALFRSLLDSKLIDAVEVSVFPVLLSAGIRLLPEGSRAKLKLESCNPLPSGVVMLSYSVSQL